MKQLLCLCWYGYACLLFSYPLKAQNPAVPDSLKIDINSQFDRGSIGSLKQTAPDTLTGYLMAWQQANKANFQNYWFYLRLAGVENRRITTILSQTAARYNAAKHQVYCAYTQPVYSYDRQNWHRITSVAYNQNNEHFQFTQHFLHDTAWIAYAHPFPLSRAQNLIDSLLLSPFVSVDTIGKSSLNYPIELLTITDTAVPDSHKKKILLMALQHPGEDAGGYFIEGAGHYLISDSATEIRRQYIYYIIPVLNPDGLLHGTTRFSYTMTDLNREWLLPNQGQTTEPEVEAVLTWIDSLNALNDSLPPIDIMIDVHCHSQRERVNCLLLPNYNLTGLATAFNTFWPVCQRAGGTNGSATRYFYSRYHIPTGTLELSQSYVNTPDKYITIADYRHYGKKTLLAIDSFLKNYNRK